MPRQHLSVTFSVALPSHGAGLAYWPVRRASSFADEAEREKFQRAERRFQPCTVGEVVFHSGHTPHQSVLMAEARPGEDRITLQAHGALTNTGEYLLYW